MNPKTIQVLILVVAALMMGSQFVAQNFPQYTDAAHAAAGFLSTVSACLAAHSLPTTADAPKAPVQP